MKLNLGGRPRCKKSGEYRVPASPASFRDDVRWRSDDSRHVPAAGFRLRSGYIDGSTRRSPGNLSGSRYWSGCLPQPGGSSGCRNDCKCCGIVPAASKCIGFRKSDFRTGSSCPAFSGKPAEPAADRPIAASPSEVILPSREWSLAADTSRGGSSPCPAAVFDFPPQLARPPFHRSFCRSRGGHNGGGHPEHPMLIDA